MRQELPHSKSISKMELHESSRRALIDLKRDRNIYLEGNVLKLLESSGDLEFQEYIESAIERDRENRRKRLDITKHVQSQNISLLKSQEDNSTLLEELKMTLKSVEESKAQIESQNNELIEWRNENERINLELKEALSEAESAKMKAEVAKQVAESDLDFLQKKTQFQLMGRIVKVALIIIIGIGISTTALYAVALYTDKDTQTIGSTWSNMLGILLTNAFSIIGTIMGVKYASEKAGE